MNGYVGGILFYVFIMLAAIVTLLIDVSPLSNLEKFCKGATVGAALTYSGFSLVEWIQVWRE